MPLTYRTQTIDRLWTILEADSGFSTAFNAMREIKDTPKGYLKKLVLRTPADLPNIAIDLGPNFGGSIFMQPNGRAQTFASEKLGFGSSPGDQWDEVANADITVTLSFDKARHDYSVRDRLEMTVIEAIRGAGVAIGLSFVTAIGDYKAVTRQGQIEAGSRGSLPVIQTVITLPFKYELSGAAV